jgi:Na+-driven multidrug efflux pump
LPGGDPSRLTSFTGNIIVANSKTLWKSFVVFLAPMMLHIVLWGSVLFGMATVVSGMMRASGTVFASMALPIFAIAAVEVPSAVLLSRSIGVEGIWAAYPTTFTAMFILQMSYYMLVWRRRTVQRLI